MKSLLSLALAAALAAAAAGAHAETNVGVSIGINQPGVYGRVDIGNFPQPAVVYAQPVLIERPRVVVDRRPIYLYVPPGHQKNWSKHCGRYAACGQPVYFVQEQWVRERYVREHPGWRDRRDDDRRGHGHGHDRDRDRDRDDRGDRGERGHHGNKHRD